VKDFAEFFGARRDVAYRAVLVVVGDRTKAEDAVAEAFARAYQHWSKVAEHPNATAWVIRVALNVSRSWWRSRRREVLTSGGHEPSSVGAAPGGPLDDALAAAVRALPRRQREVVALRLLADLSAQETGGLLGISAATVHVHLHRALEALRTALATAAPRHSQDDQPATAAQVRTAHSVERAR
jgi:RNA polymerase sigma factor (sigma-70 family)